MVRLIETVRKENDSIGGVIECIVRGLPSVSVNRCSETGCASRPCDPFNRSGEGIQFDRVRPVGDARQSGE